jgi:type III secretion system low calcium response chaperone LcrH/SycD
MESEQQQSGGEEIPYDLLKQFEKELSEESTGAATEKVTSAVSLAGGPAKDTIKALLTQAMTKGVMPKTALRLGDETMEAMYAQGYNLYNQGKYKEASYVFRLLMLLDYLTPKYTLGLAACLHRLKDYKNAANIYLLCGTLDAQNPLPHYHAADCYIQLGLPPLALFSLDMAITVAADQPQYSVIKERARCMRETVHKEIVGSLEKEEKPKK